MREFLGSGESVEDARFATLTPRERELLELIARGCDNAQIAAHMQLSEKTVRNHITSVFAKLDVNPEAFTTGPMFPTQSFQGPAPTS